MFQRSNKIKTPEELSKMEIGNLPEKELKVIIINMIKELERRMDEQRENLEGLHQELEHKENDQTDEKYSN